MKKILSMTLILALCLGLLAGCGGSSGASSAASDAPAIVVPVKEEAVKQKPSEDGSQRSRSGKRHSAPKSSGAGTQKTGETAPVKVQKHTVQPAEASDGGKSEKKNGKPRRRHYHGKKPSGKPASES